MKTLTISAPDKDFNETIEAICDLNGYKSGDKIDFAKNLLLDRLGAIRDSAERRKTRPTREQRQAERTAAKEKHDKVKKDVKVTVS